MLAFAEIAEEINMHNQGKENDDLNMSDQGSDQENMRIRRQKMMKMEWMRRPLLMKNFYKGRKSTKRRQSKEIDCKAKINALLLHNNSWSFYSDSRENNHDLDARLSRFMTSHREMSRYLKSHLVAHDIAGLRPSKSIRLLEVQVGGLENMRCTLKDCRNYILQQMRLRTLTTDGKAISGFF
ncbi:hypothetical protein RND71_020259 [Anisodus tanguticus]|uniref:Uncharacterized protein n=1 Tax=Anisodus tanguticus TaxID=243964 RepID=A0AAE1S252_9SOLA|nr:hypothetical protein RND71_020259 [Anisodus tanguticus]